MKTIIYSISAAIAVGLSAAPLCAVDAPKPNIVHIMIDDMGWQDIASHKIDGKPVYETPHLDNLTKDGHSNPYYASMVDTVDWMIGRGDLSRSDR